MHIPFFFWNIWFAVILLLYLFHKIECLHFVCWNRMFACSINLIEKKKTFATISSPLNYAAFVTIFFSLLTIVLIKALYKLCCEWTGVYIYLIFFFVKKDQVNFLFLFVYTRARRYKTFLLFYHYLIISFFTTLYQYRIRFSESDISLRQGCLKLSLLYSLNNNTGCYARHLSLRHGCV